MLGSTGIGLILKSIKVDYKFVHIVTDIASPVHSSCFGVSNIGNVVDVTLL
jgi:hypothetical protein